MRIFIEQAANMYGYTLNDFKKRGTADMTELKHIIAHICYYNFKRDSLRPVTLKYIAKEMGRKDHTTIMHSIKKCQTLMQIYKDFAERYRNVESLLDVEKKESVILICDERGNPKIPSQGIKPALHL